MKRGIKKGYLFISLFVSVLACFIFIQSLVSASSATSVSGGEGWKVAVGTSPITLFFNSAVVYIINSGAFSIFIPTRTLGEWNSFLSNLPPGVSTTSCPSGYTCPNGYSAGKSCYVTGDSSLCGGTISSTGTCGNFASKGTSCNSGGTLSCDGSGHCQGWSGTGCGSCPFGSSSNGLSATMCNLNGDQGRYCSIGSSATNYCSTSSYGYTYWKNWNYTSSTYSPNPVCQVTEAMCCGWQIICITPRCSTTTDYPWEMKP